MLRVLEKRVLRQIFAPKMEDLKGDWRSLPYDWYLPNIVWVITSSRMRKLVMWHIWGREEVHAGM